MLRINNAANFRRTLAGLCLVAAPILFGVSDVMRLSIEGGVAEGAEQLAAIADNVGRWKTLTVLNMFGVILFLPAILGVMHLLRRRSVALGHIGGAFALIGVLGFATHAAGYFMHYGALSTSEIERSQQVAYTDHLVMNGGPAVWIYVAMFLLGFLVGPLLLGIGLYRARVVERWAAGLVILGSLAWTVVAFSPWAESMLLIGLVWLLMSAGFGAVGVHVLRMKDEAWEAMSSAAAASTAVLTEHGTTAATHLPADTRLGAH